MTSTSSHLLYLHPEKRFGRSLNIGKPGAASVHLAARNLKTDKPFNRFRFEFVWNLDKIFSFNEIVQAIRSSRRCGPKKEKLYEKFYGNRAACPRRVLWLT
ncbi:MAG: hypothetical protein ACPHIA_05855, partial [Alphaproteobacteria bacterium]